MAIFETSFGLDYVLDGFTCPQIEVLLVLYDQKLEGGMDPQTETN